MRAASAFLRGQLATIATVIVITALALAPLLGAGVYGIVVLTSMLGYALLAMSINLMAGHTGLLTLAHGAYAGVGAYAAALTSQHVTQNGVLQLAAAVLAGALIAATTGWIVVRATKTFFLMLSLAIGELLYILALQWRPLTRGSDGLSAGGPFQIIPDTPIILTGYVYWISLVVFCVFGGLVLLVVRSPFGAALRGIRDNEVRMRGLGYPTSLYKYSAWIFSGAIAGAAGWILVSQLPRFVAPSLLSFRLAGLLLLAVVIGGLGSMWGSCIGAAIVVLMTDVISQDLGGRGPLLLGLVFVIAVYVLPRGLAGVMNRPRPEGRGASGGSGTNGGGTGAEAVPNGTSLGPPTEVSA